MDAPEDRGRAGNTLCRFSWRSTLWSMIGEQPIAGVLGRSGSVSARTHLVHHQLPAFGPEDEIEVTRLALSVDHLARFQKQASADGAAAVVERDVPEARGRVAGAGRSGAVDFHVLGHVAVDDVRRL